MMVLYSGTTCPFSHRCRFVLFEKGMDFEIRDVDLYNKPEDINVMNPYGQVPILVERDLILYESNIINEYIDERFPQLAPVFLKNKYMLGENFSMLDVAIAPLLWRLDYYGIELSKNAAPLLKYAERIFSRPAYIEALTPSEKVMRK